MKKIIFFIKNINFLCFLSFFGKIPKNTLLGQVENGLPLDVTVEQRIKFLDEADFFGKKSTEMRYSTTRSH